MRAARNFAENMERFPAGYTTRSVLRKNKNCSSGALSVTIPGKVLPFPAEVGIMGDESAPVFITQGRWMGEDFPSDKERFRGSPEGLQGKSTRYVG